MSDLFAVFAFISCGYYVIGRTPRDALTGGFYVIGVAGIFVAICIGIVGMMWVMS